MLRTLIVALLVSANSFAADLVPLDRLGTTTYFGFTGGLYENGSNTTPPDHLAVGLARASLVVPRDRDGHPSSSGKIVMLSIGMSNTTQEFCATNNPQPCTSWSFVGQATSDPVVNHDTLVFVNGAAGGKTAGQWTSSTSPEYTRIRDNDLAPQGLTEAQVQVAWVKVANAQPRVSLPAQDADANVLVNQIGNIARALETRYPNLQLVYLASRIYAGFATSTLNPEPYAYESGFGVKWVIDAQIQQERSGRVTDTRAGDLGPSVSPWLAWGPYMWWNETTPRADGLVWMRADFEGDGTHPSQSGEQKVGAQLLRFFKSEPTAQSWFVHNAAPKRRAVHH